MKTLKNTGTLTLIWIISILGFSVGFSLDIVIRMFNDKAAAPWEIILIFMVWFIPCIILALICSLPSFLGFAIPSIILLQFNIPVVAKRIGMLLINAVVITLTSSAAFVFIAAGAKDDDAFLYPLSEFLLWLPNLAVWILSVAGILLIPIAKTTPPSTSPKNELL